MFKAAEDQFPDFGKRSFPLRGHVNSDGTESKRKAKEQEQEEVAKGMERNKVKGPRKLSTEDMKKNAPTATVRQSTGRGPTMSSGGEDDIEMGIMSALLDDKLRKVQEEREAEEKKEEAKEEVETDMKDGKEKEYEVQSTSHEKERRDSASTTDEREKLDSGNTIDTTEKLISEKDVNSDTDGAVETKDTNKMGEIRQPTV